MLAGSLLSPMIEAFSTLFDALFLPLGDFISAHSGAFGWIADLLSQSFLGGFLLNISLGGLLLGSGLLTVLVIAVIKFFLPTS